MKFSNKFSYFLGMSSLYRTFAGLAVLGFGLGVTACSEDAKTAGGGPSGTEAGNAITAQIFASNATPASLARVKLIDSESIDGATQSYTTDKDGKVVIEGISAGNYTLEASLDDKALQVNVEVSSEDLDLGSATLEKTARISGIVEGESGTVKVRGMDHSATVVDGKFKMDLPAGPISLVFIPSEKGDTVSSYIKAAAGEDIKATSFANESKYLLLDDFQDGNYQNRFMPAHTYDGGWWYFDFNRNNVTASVATKDFKPVLENEDGNISAHVAAVFGDIYEDEHSVKTWPWAVIGVELGKSDKKLCNDISSVDSIAFKAKGDGNIVFTLVDETQDMDKHEIMSYEFSVGENWTRYSVPIKDLIFDGFSLNCVNQLAWKLSSPATPPTDEEPNPAIDLWLDDIQLIGGNRLSIWEK